MNCLQILADMVSWQLRQDLKGILQLGRLHNAMVSILASSPSCPLFVYQSSKNLLRGKNDDVAEVNQCYCLEESGQRLENVDGTHLLLASGKLVLQKGHSTRTRAPMKRR